MRPTPMALTPDLVDAGLVVGWLLVTALVVVRYVRGSLAYPRALLYAGTSLLWVGYSVLQLTRGGPVATGTTLNATLDALAVAFLLTGLYVLYRRWRGPGTTEDSG